MAIAKKPRSQPAERAASRDDQAAEAFIERAGQATHAPAPDDRKVPVTMRYDRAVLTRLDAAAKRLGISRSAYVHIAISRALEQE